MSLNLRPLFALLGFACVLPCYSAPVTCTTGAIAGGGTGIVLTEPPESALVELLICALPSGFAAPLIPTALVLTDSPQDVLPLIISDLILFEPTGLITFFSDPSLPELPPFAEFQAEAAQNIFVVNGTTYLISSGLDEPGESELPEPATFFTTGTVIAAVIGFRRKAWFSLR